MELQMKDRLREIINLKAGGKQKDFAEIMGWPPQKMTKLLAGDSFGIQTVAAILEKFPDIDARWFILGQGQIFNPQGRELLLDSVIRILDYDKYFRYMDKDEQLYYTRCLCTHTIPTFRQDRVQVWAAAKEAEDRIHREAFEKATGVRRKRNAE